MKELTKEQQFELQSVEDAIDALQLVYFDGDKKDTSLGEAIDALELVVEDLLSSRYLKTKAGNYPNAQGVYDTDDADVEKIILPPSKKGGATNDVDIYVVQLENLFWTSSIHFQETDKGYSGTVIPLTEKPQFLTRKEAVLHQLNYLLNKANQPNIIKWAEKLKTTFVQPPVAQIQPEEKKPETKKENPLDKLTFTDKTLARNEVEFINYLRTNPYAGRHANKTTLEKDAASKFKILNKDGSPSQTLIKNLVEFYVVLEARKIATDTSLLPKDAYDKIVELYKNQFNLSHRSSDSILWQQYSTPATLGFLMGYYCLSNTEPSKSNLCFEPSAGSGMLTITNNPQNFYVNEIDPLRLRLLNSISFFDGNPPYQMVTQRDASEPFEQYEKEFDVVITNPPFGQAEYTRNFDGFKIKRLEHVMAIIALNTMLDTGRAAIIVGDVHKYDEHGRLKSPADYIFYNYLSSHYVLEDVININGGVFYSKMGTAFNTRLILINGRREKKEEIWLPKEDKTLITTQQFSPLLVSDFDVLFERINNLIK